MQMHCVSRLCRRRTDRWQSTSHSSDPSSNSDCCNADSGRIVGVVFSSKMSEFPIVIMNCSSVEGARRPYLGSTGLEELAKSASGGERDCCAVTAGAFSYFYDQNTVIILTMFSETYPPSFPRPLIP